MIRSNLLYAVLMLWGMVLGKGIALAISHRATLNLWIAKQKRAARGNVFKRFVVEARIVIGAIVLCAGLILSLNLLPYYILRDALRINRQRLASMAWFHAIGIGVILALAQSVPQYRRWRAWYRKWNTATCPRCTRVNDRPRFPGHHEYYFVFGYPAKMTGGRFSCRWCDAPLEFPELDPRIQEAPPGGWKIP